MDVDARDAYVELMKQCLTRSLFLDEGWPRARRRQFVTVVTEQLASRGFVIVPALPSTQPAAVRRVPGLVGSGVLVRLLARRRLLIVPDDTPRRHARTTRGRGLRAWYHRVVRTEREFGLGWPKTAETMSGLRRLDNVDACVADVLRERVPGDLLEAGVWRGGITILMRALLAAHGDDERRVWVADSFEGLPAPKPSEFPADAGLDYHLDPELAVGVQQVQANFARYGLLDDRVRVLPGWFKDTLPSAPIERLAVMRLDGDLYESTMDALEALYPKLSVGGYCIIDDYGALDACRRAVDDYRAANGITEEIRAVDWTGAYWQRASGMIDR